MPTASAVDLLATADDCIVHINQLSQEFSSSREAEGGSDEELYHMLVTKRSGSITVRITFISDRKLQTAKAVIELSAPSS